MRLEDLIEKLRKLPPQMEVRFTGAASDYPGNFDSWRGDYAQIALEHGAGTKKTVGELTEQAISAIGATFQGYKGGDFTMRADSVIYVDNYGECLGLALLDVTMITLTNGESIALLHAADISDYL